MGPRVLVRGQLRQAELDSRAEALDLGPQQAPGHPALGGEGRRVQDVDVLVPMRGDHAEVGGLGRRGQVVHAVVVAVVAHERGVDGRGVQHRLPVGIGDPAEVSVAHGPVLPRGRGRSLSDHGFPGAADAAIAAHAGPASAGGGDPAVGRRPDRSAVRAGGHRRAPAHHLPPRPGAAHAGEPAQGGDRTGRAGRPRRGPLRHPGAQGRRGLGGLEPRRHRPARPAGPARRHR